MKRKGLLLAAGCTLIIAIVVITYFTTFQGVIIETERHYLCLDCGREIKVEKSQIKLPKWQTWTSPAGPDLESLVTYDNSSLCPDCTVAVRTGTKTVCPDCGEVDVSNTETIYAAKSQKDDYRIEKIEERCQECEAEANRPGSFKYLPILLGKSRDEILKQFGKPKTAGGNLKGPFGEDLGLPLSWGYSNSETRESFKIDFKGPERNRVCYVLYDPLNPDYRPLVKDMLLRELKERSPDIKVVWLRGCFLVAFKIEQGLLKIQGGFDFEPVVVQKHFDEVEGVYETSYSVASELRSSDAWLDAQVSNYEQTAEGEITETIGSHPYGQNNGWKIYG